MVKLKDSGQTTVEYLMLFAVSTSLLLTFLNSDFYKRMFGTGGKIGKFIKAETEFGYRHAFPRNEDVADIPLDNLVGEDHPSYYNNGTTRFFGSTDPYPEKL